MKYLYLIICFFPIFLNAQDFNHQVFSAKNIDKINLVVGDYEVDIVEIQGSRLLVDTYITLTEVGQKFTRLLINRGTYNLQATYNEVESELTLSAPPRKTMIVKGNEVKEKLRYTLYVPTGVEVSVVLDVLSPQ